MGCDISVEKSGIANAGREVFIKALRSFDEEDVDALTTRSFAEKVREFARPACCHSYSVMAIAREL